MHACVLTCCCFSLISFIISIRFGVFVLFITVTMNSNNKQQQITTATTTTTSSLRDSHRLIFMFACTHTATTKKHTKVHAYIHKRKIMSTYTQHMHFLIITHIVPDIKNQFNMIHIHHCTPITYTSINIIIM